MTPVAAPATPSLTDLIARRQPNMSLEQPFYNDPAIFAQDLEKIWYRQWIFAGPAAKIPKPGDWFTTEIGTESIIVVRAQDGSIKAHFNTCRHRGSRICLSDTGHSTSLVCPYHQWNYGLDGKLLKARLMPENFDTSGWGLHPVHARVTQGLIFICLADAPPEYESFEKNIAHRLRHHQFDTAKVAFSHTYDVKSNWKLVVENSRECYHCGAGHPQYCQVVGFAAAIGSTELADDDEEIHAERKKELEPLGLETDTVVFLRERWFHFRRFYPRRGSVCQSQDGQAVAPLMGTITTRNHGIYAVVTLPNLLLEANGDYVVNIAYYPVGPQHTRVTVTWLVKGDAVEGKDYDLDKVTWFWKTTGEQDWKLCEDNQAGVNSRRYSPGPYAPDEHRDGRGTEQFIQWYLDRLSS